MKQESITITDPAGLHARPASELAKTANSFKSNINLVVGEKKANAKSILAIMSLGIKSGIDIQLECEGEDEEQAIEELKTFLQSNLE